MIVSMLHSQPCDYAIHSSYHGRVSMSETVIKLLLETVVHNYLIVYM